ncbi:hypothetical protein X801_09959 [Opisthorchis viverrini]|uniref:Uncharacterized protein n=1 Tax=Opisthorchis viverrini TaxID=6198 RepID=A0A1S8WJ16_OPIVI|nr:hypothetical protein X801_09959 [Opisthorchis viverrini]
MLFLPPLLLRTKEFSTIWPELDLIVDGGPISTCAKESARSGSTIVDLSSASKGLYHIVRPGSFLLQMH